MEKSKNIFAFKSLFKMSSSQKKYLTILEKFEHSQIHSHFQGVFDYCKPLPKLFLLGQGINVTSQGGTIASTVHCYNV